jgi:hypothetical protein
LNAVPETEGAGASTPVPGGRKRTIRLASAPASFAQILNWMEEQILIVAGAIFSVGARCLGRRNDVEP